MITKEFFGKTSKGEDVYSYKIENQKGEYIKILNYGGIIQSLLIRDKNEMLVDIVLGYDTIEDYENADKYMGAIIGRVANRIKDGKFFINEKEYSLYINNGKNHLHGGKEGFDRKIFCVEFVENSFDTIIFKLVSPDKDENYPGNVELMVKYTFNTDSEGYSVLNINYIAISDDDTPINITNHSYFNIRGYNSGTVLDTKLKLYCDYYTPNDKDSIPTGEILKVDNSPMDFREFKSIGQDINSNFEQIVYGNGYDLNFVTNSVNNDIVLFAEALDDISGIFMKAYTNQPGVQFYTGNYLDDKVKGKNKTIFNKRAGFCLETQNFPDAINKTHFPNSLLKKNQIYDKTTIYKFNTI